MAEGQDGSNGTSRVAAPATGGTTSPPDGDRIYRMPDGNGRPIWVTEKERRDWVEKGNRALAALAEMTDETDTDQLWDEVLRNLGVDPTTGRGLTP